MEHTNLINNYLESKKITVDKKELNSLKNLGFTVLKRDKNYWKSLKIDLGEARKNVEKYIIKSNEKKIRKLISKNNIVTEKETNRLQNLLELDPYFNLFIAIPDLLFSSIKILGPNIQLSSINMREPLKGGGHQGLHLDWKQRKTVNSNFYQLIAFILLDKVTSKNGPPRVIPKSHNDLVHVSSTSREKSKRNKKDHTILENNDKRSKILCGNIGDIIILNINAFHGGTTNISGKRRRVIAISYRIKSELPQTNFYYSLPKIYHEKFNKLERNILNLKPRSTLEKIKFFILINKHNSFLKLAFKLKEKITHVLTKLFY